MKLSETFRIVRRHDGTPPDDARPLTPAAARAALAPVDTDPSDFGDPVAGAEHFVLDPTLETAINMALAVRAPLLLTGEPGTGKTTVAYYLGRYFGVPVFPFQVRSDASAEALKFDFDAVAYLNAAQHPDKRGERPERPERTDPAFLKRRALWQAYDHAGPSVLLIDEIDKAPRDFPNDLLQELGQHRFRHPFEDCDVEPQSGRPPIVVITSNAERRLPEPFLRRCIFHHIELTEPVIRAAVAVRVKAGHFPGLAEDAREAALGRFMELRALRTELRKTPSTGELLVWLTILSAAGARAADLGPTVSIGRLPALTALIKQREDLDRLGRPR